MTMALDDAMPLIVAMVSGYTTQLQVVNLAVGVRRPFLTNALLIC